MTVSWWSAFIQNTFCASGNVPWHSRLQFNAQMTTSDQQQWRMNSGEAENKQQLCPVWRSTAKTSANVSGLWLYSTWWCTREYQLHRPTVITSTGQTCNMSTTVVLQELMAECQHQDACSKQNHRVLLTFPTKKRNTTTITTILRPFFQDHLCDWCQKRTSGLYVWCKGRLTEADTPTIRLGANPSGLTSAHLHHPHFYRPDALPATQPTVSKHWRQITKKKQKKHSLRKNPISLVRLTKEM